MKLFYRHYGQGKPLLILHGLFGMSDNWMTLAKHFGENGFAVYAVDLRNHGQSPHSAEFSYELMTDDVMELMNDLSEVIHSNSMVIRGNSVEVGTTELQPNYNQITFSVIGHSMGAKVAMLLALQHPNRIEKLIAVDMAPRYYPPHHQYIFDAIYALGDMAAYKSRKEVEQKLSSSLRNESTRQFLLKNLYWKKTGRGEELAWRFNLPVIERNVEDLNVTLNGLPPFNKPALFIKGEKSDYITAKDEPEIRSLFPQVIFKTIAGAGHWVHADKPKEFFETVMGFLSS
jgi:pimeloyl-ACP methyl ester carboxylesterase